MPCEVYRVVQPQEFHCRRDIQLEPSFHLQIIITQLEVKNFRFHFFVGCYERQSPCLRGGCPLEIRLLRGRSGIWHFKQRKVNQYQQNYGLQMVHKPFSLSSESTKSLFARNDLMSGMLPLAFIVRLKVPCLFFSTETKEGRTRPNVTISLCKDTAPCPIQRLPFYSLEDVHDL